MHQQFVNAVNSLGIDSECFVLLELRKIAGSSESEGLVTRLRYAHSSDSWTQQSTLACIKIGHQYQHARMGSVAMSVKALEACQMKHEAYAILISRPRANVL